MVESPETDTKEFSMKLIPKNFFPELDPKKFMYTH